MKNNDERLEDIFKRLDNLSYIKPNTIPDLDLYMDQVTTFMDEHLRNSKRYAEDKVLTKTMINNYAKNNILPPPLKKKYSKNHILMLIYIYYFKNILLFHDIEELFRPITEKHFKNSAEPSLSELYSKIFSMEKSQMDRLKDDLADKYKCAKEVFPDSEEDADQAFLQLFAFICELGFDVYLKKQTIEFLIDQLREESADTPKKKK